MNKFLRWLPTTLFAGMVFTAFYCLYLLHLPYGWPRFVAAGAVVILSVITWEAARKAYDRK